MTNQTPTTQEIFGMNAAEAAEFSNPITVEQVEMAIPDSRTEAAIALFNQPTQVEEVNETYDKIVAGGF